MSSEKIHLAQRKVREKSFHRDLQKAVAVVKQCEDEVTLAGKELDAAKEKLAGFLEKLNAVETLWRRVSHADRLIQAHQRRIAEAYARKDRAWSMLMRANESLASISRQQQHNLERILQLKLELARQK
jgi:chromosome segregation ATPase